MNNFPKEHWASRVLGKIFVTAFSLLAKAVRVFRKPSWDKKEKE